MIKVAFTLIGGYQWFGGYNYQLNLIKALIKYESHRIQPLIFLSDDVDKKILQSFIDIEGLQVIQSATFNQSTTNKRLLRALLLGRDQQAFKAFSSHDIDVVFEVANFYGWRFPISKVAWIPDLQHKLMRHLFNNFSYWKREIGFQFQIITSKKIMLSSQDARASLERFYPKAIGKTCVARFAVPSQPFSGDINALKKKYDLPENFFFLPNQFWQHKNHRCVIEALAIVKELGHDIIVIATGNITDPRNPLHFANLKKEIAQNELEKNFQILGAIPYQDILGLMQTCKALINPSLFEGWSTTVEEAKALGLNMLLSNLKVHQEQAAEQAIFFNPQSPTELAQKLIDFEINNNNTQNRVFGEIQQTADERVAAYASNFADIMMLSV